MLQRFWGLLLATGGCLAGVEAADVRISKPEPDQVVRSHQLVLSGHAVAEDGPNMVSISRKLSSAANSTEIAQAMLDGNGDWTATVPLVPGTQLLVVTLAGATDQILVTRAGDAIGRQPPQKVRLQWVNGTDEKQQVDRQIRLVAERTLDPPPAEPQLSAFVDDVKGRVRQLFVERFQGVANLVVVDQDGPDVHTVNFLATDDGLFGQSPFDCGSVSRNEATEVHVGTYRRSMSNLGQWKPMQRGDLPSVRAEDLARCLARTAAHEVGHSLGLVGDPAVPAWKCLWMRGCEEGHNCFSITDTFDIADRFDDGWYLMDSGPRTTNRARLGEEFESRRSLVRRAPVFNTFNRSYLQIVHP